MIKMREETGRRPKQAEALEQTISALKISTKYKHYAIIILWKLVLNTLYSNLGHHFVDQQLPVVNINPAIEQ